MAMAPLKEFLHQYADDDRPAPAPMRSQHGIQHVRTKLWVGEHNHWVEAQHALRFDFAFLALAYATEMGFALDTFTVEPL